MDNISFVKRNFIDYVNKIIKNKKISHTYLIEIGDYNTDSFYIYNFIKMILCDKSYEEILSSKDPIIELIDSNNYPDISVIKPDGSTIKKSQLLDLQKDYNNKSLLDNKRIYIIEEADKLNIASANTILKFLEEPEDGIIAFLVTNNRYRVIQTILSRCQVLTLKENNFNIDYDDNLIELLKYVLNPRDFFIKYNYFVGNVLVDKDNLKKNIISIENMIIHYLNSFYLEKDDFNVELSEIFRKIDVTVLIKYLSILEEEIPKLEYNINYKLWIDAFFAKLVIGG